MSNCGQGDKGANGEIFSLYRSKDKLDFVLRRLRFPPFSVHTLTFLADNREGFREYGQDFPEFFGISAIILSEHSSSSSVVSFFLPFAD